MIFQECSIKGRTYGTSFKTSLCNVIIPSKDKIQKIEILSIVYVVFVYIYFCFFVVETSYLDHEGDKHLSPSMSQFQNYSRSLDEQWKAIGIKEPRPGAGRPEYVDQRLLDAIKTGDADVLDFFRLMAICHTVRPDHKSDGTTDYQAESPDEKALVDCARSC